MSSDEIKGKVLIIDDQKYWRDTIAQMLNLRGYLSIEAVDLPTAIDALANEKFDIVTIDMEFKGKGKSLGETVLELIRKDYATIACIMISGSVDSFNRVDELKDDLGLGAFVHKNELKPAILEKAIEKAKKTVEREQQKILEDSIHTLQINTLQEYRQNLLELEHNLAAQKTRLIQLNRDLMKVEIKKANFGLDVPIHVLNEIEGYEQEIAKAEGDMAKINNQILETKAKINELERLV